MVLESSVTTSLREGLSKLIFANKSLMSSIALSLSEMPDKSASLIDHLVIFINIKTQDKNV